MYRQWFRQKFHVGFRAMSTENDVLFESVGNAGVTTLNRPKALNALNLSMLEKLNTKLMQWENEKVLVITKGTDGSKVFCSGGDIRAVTEANLQGTRYGYEVVKKAYKLTGIVGTYKIPHIAVIDGISLGGAVGLSALGRYCIATERTIFAMPETTIGICPDGGSSYFFSRLEGKLGFYLTLLNHRLKGSDVMKAGIATHYIDGKDIKETEKALVQCKDGQNIDSVLNKFSVTDYNEFSLEPHLDKINKCFDAKTVEEIIENLEKDGSSWAQDSLKALRKTCPTSLKVTFKALQLGRKLSLSECLRMEYRISTNCFANKNYYEGVRAIVVDKDQNPKWIPPTLAEVTDEFVDSHFLLLPGEEDLKHEQR